MAITSQSIVGNLQQGSELQALNITSVDAGQWNADFSIQSDALLVTLIATSVSSSLDVSVVGIDQESGLESEDIIAFPQITGPASNLIIRRSGTAPASLRLKVVTGVGGATFRVKVRAVNAGTSDTKILGAGGMEVDQQTVDTTPIVLIATALTDRAGILVKNWSGTQTIYIAETMAKANSAIGYPLGPKDAISMDVDAGVTIWAVSDAVGADVRLVEAGG